MLERSTTGEKVSCHSMPSQRKAVPDSATLRNTSSKSFILLQMDKKKSQPIGKGKYAACGVKFAPLLHSRGANLNLYYLTLFWFFYLST